MLAVMPLRVLREWAIYAQYEPFGEERGDLRMSILASVMANLWGRKKSAPPFKLKQFMPEFRRDAKRALSPDELFEKVKMLNALFGGEEVGSFVVETDVPESEREDYGD